MDKQENISLLIEKFTHSNYFRTEYAEDGYITITKKSDDSYEIDIQQVSFLDQATHAFHYCNTQELILYLERHIEQLGEIF